MFRFETKLGWSVVLYGKDRKEAINKMLEITGPGVAFEVHDVVAERVKVI